MGPSRTFIGRFWTSKKGVFEAQNMLWAEEQIEAACTKGSSFCRIPCGTSKLRQKRREVTTDWGKQATSMLCNLELQDGLALNPRAATSAMQVFNHSTRSRYPADNPCVAAVFRQNRQTRGFLGAAWGRFLRAAIHRLSVPGRPRAAKGGDTKGRPMEAWWLRFALSIGGKRKTEAIGGITPSSHLPVAKEPLQNQQDMVYLFW